MRRTDLYKILFLVTFWVLSSVFIAFYDASVEAFEAGERGLHAGFSRELLTVVLITSAGAAAVASGEVLFLSRLLRKRPYGITLLAKTTFFLCCIFVFTSAAMILIYSQEQANPVYHREVLGRYVEYLSHPRSVMTFAFWGFSVLVALFVLQVNDKFGQGVLMDFLRGKYHRPREEHRIFMFMDLKSSTTYAEKLGHIKYSQLIQDCFFDLTDVVAAHNAHIYQYVGDEVVLTWDTERGAVTGDCLGVFYAYDDAIRRRGSYYEAKYGLVPEFKAGLNAGRVTVAEVGEIKKELAYHGDVLNTASRIQGKCNELGRRLLISEEMKGQMNGLAGYQFGFMGDVALKGKDHSVRIYDVKVATP
jgi:adenylate cyclase